MDRHLQYAAKMQRELQRIQGRYEHWYGPDGNWLYDIERHRWIKAEVTC